MHWASFFEFWKIKREMQCPSAKKYIKILNFNDFCVLTTLILQLIILKMIFTAKFTKRIKH